MIKADKIYKSFGDLEVLGGITVTFQKGINNLIIGRSGAGKTVLLKLLVGLLSPTSGTVYYDDVDFFSLSKKETRALRMQVGMLFQGNALFDSLTTEENVRFPLDMFTTMTKKEKLDRVNDCLARVELSGVNEKYPSEISGGMKKRVGIARAIVLNPRYLFCDEPNSGLDPQTAIVIDNLIVDLTREFNMTTVVVSHDMNSVMEASDFIHFVHQGQIAWNGPTSELLTAKSEALNEFIFASKIMRELRKTIS